MIYSGTICLEKRGSWITTGERRKELTMSSKKTIIIEQCASQVSSTWSQSAENSKDRRCQLAATTHFQAHRRARVIAELEAIGINKIYSKIFSYPIFNIYLPSISTTYPFAKSHSL